MARVRFIGRLIGGGLLLATAAIHLDLYITGYRTIPTIGWLFLTQVATAFLLAVAVVLLESRILQGSAALFALSTLGGYLLSLWIGLFGFREVRTSAGVWAGIIEVAAFAVLGAVALLGAGQQAPTAFGPDAWRRLVHLEVGALSGLSIVAFALLGAGLATANNATQRARTSTVELRARRIDGVDVLTDAKGLTLYLFVPDSATTSRCYGECAVYWPPVLGKPVAGPGLTGRLGTIRRADGTDQATYDGHPLYSYVADSAPGQANGNAINLNGGYWYDVTTSGNRG